MWRAATAICLNCATVWLQSTNQLYYLKREDQITAIFPHFMENASHDTLGKEIIQIIKSRNQFFNQNYPRVREAYHTAYNWPEMDTLRHEITLCLIFGLHQAAITLTNHLLESLLKLALTIHHSEAPEHVEPAQSSHTIESFIQIFRSAMSKFGSDTLLRNIDRAAVAQLISEEQKDQLHEFRKVFRNAYSHSDKNKTFGTTRIPAQSIHIEDGKLVVEKPEDPLLSELLIAHGLAQAKQAEQDAIPYFLYMDSVVRQIKTRLFGPLQEEGGGVTRSSEPNDQKQSRT